MEQFNPIQQNEVVVLMTKEERQKQEQANLCAVSVLVHIYLM